MKVSKVKFNVAYKLILGFVFFSFIPFFSFASAVPIGTPPMNLIGSQLIATTTSPTADSGSACYQKLGTGLSGYPYELEIQLNPNSAGAATTTAMLVKCTTSECSAYTNALYSINNINFTASQTGTTTLYYSWASTSPYWSFDPSSYYMVYINYARQSAAGQSYYHIGMQTGTDNFTCVGSTNVLTNMYYRLWSTDVYKTTRLISFVPKRNAIVATSTSIMWSYYANSGDVGDYDLFRLVFYNRDSSLPDFPIMHDVYDVQTDVIDSITVPYYEISMFSNGFDAGYYDVQLWLWDNGDNIGYLLGESSFIASTSDVYDLTTDQGWFAWLGSQFARNYYGVNDEFPSGVFVGTTTASTTVMSILGKVFPFCYVRDSYNLLTSSATTSIPTWDITLPYSWSNASISVDINGIFDWFLYSTSTLIGTDDTVVDVVMPYWTNFLYFLFFVYVLTSLL